MPEKKGLRKQLRASLASETFSPEGLRELLTEANPIDIAMVIGNFETDQMRLIFGSLDEQVRPVVIDETDDATRERLLLLSPPEEIGRIMGQMPPDEATDLLEAVPEEDRHAVLMSVDDEKAKEISRLDQYPSDSAGGIMTPYFVRASADDTVGAVLQQVIQNEDAEAQNIVFLLDAAEKLVGIVKLADIIGLHRAELVIAHAGQEPITANVLDDQEAVATLASRYHLSIVPVVDDAGRLLGVVTHDDLVDVLAEEAAEDFYKLAGETYQPMRGPFLGHVAKRMPWLGVTLVGGMISSYLLNHILAGQTRGAGPVVFLPVILGMAGNVGIQSSTMIVRGLATGELDEVSRLRVFSRELGAGLLIGLICGLLTAGVAHVLQGSVQHGIGLAAGFGMWAGIFIAAAMGTFIPLACHRISVDPAIAAGPFITTMNDIVGVVIYMNIANHLMRA